MSDSNSQAPRPEFTASRRGDRATDELIGICRGVLADGHVNAQEAEFLLSWIERNARFRNQWPFETLYERLISILEDGVIDPEESADLHDTLARFVGGEHDDPIAEITSAGTTLPLDAPPPNIHFTGHVFVVSGTFDFGKRKVVTAEIVCRGGQVANGISRSVNYLVIGELGSRDWIHSNSGRKIESAIAIRASGVPLSIVHEAHWRKALDAS